MYLVPARYTKSQPALIFSALTFKYKKNAMTRMASGLLAKSPYRELLTVCALVFVVLCCALAGLMHVDQRQRQRKCDPC